MKTLKNIISLIFLISLAVSVIFNFLFIFNVTGKALPQIGMLIIVLTAFLIGLLGIIIKNIRKEEYVAINIITPAKEFGIIYVGALIVWAVTYFIVVIFG